MWPVIHAIVIETMPKHNSTCISVYCNRFADLSTCIIIMANANETGGMSM